MVKLVDSESDCLGTNSDRPSLLRVASLKKKNRKANYICSSDKR